jgi:hypothetical protein
MDRQVTVASALFCATLVETFTSHSDNLIMPLCASLVLIAFSLVGVR